MREKKYKLLTFGLALLTLLAVYFILEKPWLASQGTPLKEAQTSALESLPQRLATGLPQSEKSLSEGGDPGENKTLGKGLEVDELFPVHIMGQVINTGVYYVKQQSILADLVNLAGGLTKEADLLLVNLAEPINPHQKIYIPSKAEMEEDLEKYKSFLQANHGQFDGNRSQDKSQADPKEDKKVNINRADSPELQTLSGIGPSRAEAIIKHREEYGDFLQIEDLMLVPGIKENSFKKLKDFITVN